MVLFIWDEMKWAWSSLSNCTKIAVFFWQEIVRVYTYAIKQKQKCPKEKLSIGKTVVALWFIVYVLFRHYLRTSFGLMIWSFSCVEADQPRLVRFSLSKKFAKNPIDNYTYYVIYLYGFVWLTSMPKKEMLVSILNDSEQLHVLLTEHVRLLRIKP